MQYIIGKFISFFLAVIILTKKGRNQADLILGTWMIFIGIHLSSYYLFVSDIVFTYPIIAFLNFPMPFIHGPFLFLYTLSLSSDKSLKVNEIALHFVLPLIVILIFSPYLFYSFKEKINIIQSNGKDFYFQIIIVTVLLNISGIFYVFINYKLLEKHRKHILDEFSYQEKINLNWLRVLFYGMAIMWVFIIIVQNDVVIFSASSVFVIFIGFYGIKQVGIFTNYNQYALPDESENVIESLLISPLIEKKKYAKSGLNEDVSKKLHLQLTTLMETERLFTEPDLNLTDLATRLDIHPNYLSQVINEIEGVNFYDYINTLRIEEFKRLVALPENQKFTFLAMAYDCGFNSKSAFNRFFKKSTGLSPSEYLKSQNL
ncbi:AraC family transcriptional regulator [Lacihabitans sp. LS3-19]|uniref:helix-turn-helix domain-containing protein n=1 Tax=Lacihabitans sp. LS3-19 TaxID=2487335 RepID=UPI0020CE2C6B|nr:helix-turn-helix domain-containing protein [Lacihabitans sp. LS3-19]MCP9767223.1 AraC family transcriptional regulator [Lacihabitans sp. LS3-19]